MLDRQPRVLSDAVDEPIIEALKATKTCPFCAEQVLSAAIKCKHCGSELADHLLAPNH